MLPTTSASFCQADSECGGDLRCSRQDGERGVCTYPEGVLDAAAAEDLSAVDAGSEDAASSDDGMTDGSPDGSSDAGILDAAPDTN